MDGFLHGQLGPAVARAHLLADQIQRPADHLGVDVAAEDDDEPADVGGQLQWRQGKARKLFRTNRTSRR